jgi:hypothetical protein
MATGLPPLLKAQCIFRTRPPPLEGNCPFPRPGAQRARTCQQVLVQRSTGAKALRRAINRFLRTAWTKRNATVKKSTTGSQLCKATAIYDSDPVCRDAVSGIMICSGRMPFEHTLYCRLILKYYIQNLPPAAKGIESLWNPQLRHVWFTYISKQNCHTPLRGSGGNHFPQRVPRAGPLASGFQGQSPWPAGFKGRVLGRRRQSQW